MPAEKKIYFDARWIENHGIGRFASEMSQSSLLKKQAVFARGAFADIFSPLDPLKLASAMTRHSWFLSPSYNCPVWPASRSLITLHDLMHIRYPHYASLKNRSYYQLLVRRVCRRAPLVFTVSEFSKGEICDWAGIPPDKVVVIYNGVDSTFHPGVQALARNRPYLLYIGDRKSHKNIEGIVKAFSCAGLPEDVQLVLSGKSDAQLFEIAKKFGIADRLVFSGFIPEPDLPGVYKGALALLMPSFYEGFGLPLLEAMAVGTPVLTSNCTAMPEVAGNAALLVDPYRIDDIAEGIDNIVNNGSLRSQLVSRGLARASAFDWQASRRTLDASLARILD